jgi:ribokinase
LATRSLRPGLQLAVLGAINWDTTVFVKEFARSGEEVPAFALEEGPGGKGANTAVAAARVLGGGSVAFLGALGSDPVAASLLESLGDEGIRSDGVVKLKGVGSGRAIIVVDEGGRKSIHTHFGANERYAPSHVRSPESSAILAAAHTAVVMDVPLDTALAAVGLAGPQTRVVYSPGVRSAGDPREISRVAEGVDDLVLDRSELARMSGSRDPGEGIRTLQERFPGVTLVATLGPDGALVCTGGEVSPVEPASLRDLGLKAVNSTGSGDAFLGAYACFSMMGLPPAEAASWGNLAGALKAANPETRGSPHRKELEEGMVALKGLRGPPRG